MIIIYHGRRPYLPLLACALHLGLHRGAEPFLPAYLKHDWRAVPFIVAGADRNGAAVCCLVRGRYGGLYWRALAGVAAIFGLSIAWVDVEKRLAGMNFLSWTVFQLISRWPALFGRRFQAAAAKALRPGLLAR